MSAALIAGAAHVQLFHVVSSGLGEDVIGQADQRFSFAHF